MCREYYCRLVLKIVKSLNSESPLSFGTTQSDSENALKIH